MKYDLQNDNVWRQTNNITLSKLGPESYPEF